MGSAASKCSFTHFLGVSGALVVLCAARVAYYSGGPASATKVAVPWHSIKHVVLDLDNTCFPTRESLARVMQQAASNPQLETLVGSWPDTAIAALQRIAAKDIQDGFNAKHDLQMAHWKPGASDTGAIATAFLRSILSDRRRLKRPGSLFTDLNGHFMGPLGEAAFADGQLVLVPYDDLRPSLEQWKAAGKTIHVFSGAPARLQTLIMGFTTVGDLNDFVSSNISPLQAGSKSDSATYRKLAHSLGCAPHELMYVNDRIEESIAAHQAGLFSVAISRPGVTEDISILPPGVPVVRNFAPLLP